MELDRAGVEALPARSTVYRILVRNQLVPAATAPAAPPLSQHGYLRTIRIGALPCPLLQMTVTTAPPSESSGATVY